MAYDQNIHRICAKHTHLSQKTIFGNTALISEQILVVSPMYLSHNLAMQGDFLEEPNVSLNNKICPWK